MFGDADYDGDENLLPIERGMRRRAFFESRAPQQQFIPPEMTISMQRPQKRRSDAQMIEMWLSTGRWPDRFYQ